jgi:hypothetical protein
MQKKPVEIKMVSWFWFIIGTIIIISSYLIAYQTFGFNRTHYDENGICILPYTCSRSEIPNYYQAMISFLTGAFGMIAGFFLLRLYRWARISLIVLSWGVLINLVGMIIKCSDTAFMMYFPYTRLFTIPFLGIFFFVGSVINIMFLYKKDIREAVRIIRDLKND